MKGTQAMMMDDEQGLQQVEQRLLELKEQFLAQLKTMESSVLFQKLKVDYLGRKSQFFQWIQTLKSASEAEKRRIGPLLRAGRAELERAYQARLSEILSKERALQLMSETVDISLPGDPVPLGNLHPISQAMEKIERYFSKLGFDSIFGPEIETSYYNFDALNVPMDHPARADRDTFWLAPGYLLRTHTSGMQIRALRSQAPPLRILSPGRVFRPDSDSTHTPMFHQVEGLVVDSALTFCHLKGLIEEFLRDFFEEDLRVRFRPSYFPFTVPSAEVDIELPSKPGAWLEVLGCGMVHARVLREGGIDPERFNGFAFGLGVERLSMLYYGLSDLRSFFENDVRLLHQCKARLNSRI